MEEGRVMSDKWRKWAEPIEPTTQIAPLAGYHFEPKATDIHGKSFNVMTMVKDEEQQKESLSHDRERI